MTDRQHRDADRWGCGPVLLLFVAASLALVVWMIVVPPAPPAPARMPSLEATGSAGQPARGRESGAQRASGTGIGVKLGGPATPTADAWAPIPDPVAGERFRRAFHEAYCRCFPRGLDQFEGLIGRLSCRALLLGVPLPLYERLDVDEHLTLALARLPRWRAERCLRGLDSCDPEALDSCFAAQFGDLGDACLPYRLPCFVGRCEQSAGPDNLGTCVAPPKLGSLCRYHWDCWGEFSQGLACIQNRCVPSLRAPEARCSFYCGNDLWCDIDAPSPRCQLPRAAGAPCPPYSLFGRFCDLGLSCQPSPDGPRCAPRVGPGGRCALVRLEGNEGHGSNFSPCAADHVCAQLDDRTRRCLPRAEMGAPCQVSDQCAGVWDSRIGGASCVGRGAGGQGRCGPPPAADERCSDASVPCGPSLACDTTTGRCVPHLRLGDACIQSCGDAPAPGLQCIRGRCVAPLPEGAACVSHWKRASLGQPDCGELDCLEGRCGQVESER